MYLFYDENGVLKEIINDIPLRQGSDLINRVYVFIDRELPSNVVYSYKYKKPNSEISESIVFETSEKAIIPFNRHRDLQYFKYGKEYNFNYFDIPIDALTNEGMISFNISITDEDFNLSLELLTLNIEEGVVAITESITQSQFVYLMEMIAEYKQLYYNRIDSAESDIEDILDGSKVVDKAKKDQLGNIINTHYATETDLQTNLTKLQDGRIIVKKAEQDQEGNIIDKTYINVVEIDYNNSTNKVILTFSTPFGTITYDEIVLPKASDTKDGLLDKGDKVKLDNLAGNAETTYVKNDTKGVANGIAPLDNNTKIPLTYLYDSILGQLEYVGTFDGVTLPSMTQNLSPNRAVRKGDYFIAIGSGIINGVDFEIGDWLIFNSPSTWAKIDNTDAVSLVNNKKGVVVLDGTDINWADDENKTIKAKISEIDIELADVDDELGKKLDKTTFEAYEIDIIETLDNKADYDGYYATLHSGVADQLASPVPQIDTQEYLFRTSGGIADLGTGIAKIKSLKGHTKIFNQLVSESDWTIWRSAITKVNGKIKVEKVEEGTTYGMHQDNMLKAVVGRKYLLSVGYFKASSATGINPTQIEYSGKHLYSFIRSTSEQSVKMIFEATQTDNSKGIRFFSYQTEIGAYFEIDDIMLIDLTLMYGAGNEPSTVAEFEKDFPNAYYDYTLPTIKNISIDAIKTVGFNLYNGEYSKVVKADGNNNGYQINGAYNKVYFNTINELDGNEIELTPISNQVFPSENGYLFLTETDETTCISIVWSGWRVDDTEEYWEEERLIETTDLFPNGMNGIGEIADEITDTHKIQRFKVVDLGELDWEIEDDGVGLVKTEDLETEGEYKSYSQDNTITNKYLREEYYLLSNFDKVYGVEALSGKIRIIDSDFIGFNGTQVKQALSGVYLVYALETPIITPHEKRLQYAVDDFGTEEFILAQQSLQIPIKHKTLYNENLRDKVRRIPSVSEIGSLSELDTDDKTIVGAINETHTKVVSLDLQGLPPLTKDSVGKKGEWAIDSSYLYICVDTNTWERIAYDDTWGNE